MPYYQISIITVNGKIHSGIREINNHDINVVWRQYELKAKEVYGRDLIQFDCKMLSKISPEVKEHIANQGKKDFKHDGFPIYIPTRSRKQQYNPKISLGDRAKENDKKE